MGGAAPTTATHAQLQSPAPVAAEEGRGRRSLLTNVAVNTSSCPASYFNRLGKTGILSGRRRLSSLPVFTLYRGHLGELSWRRGINLHLLRESLSTFPRGFPALGHSRSTVSSGPSATPAYLALTQAHGAAERDWGPGECVRSAKRASRGFKSKSTEVTAQHSGGSCP